MSTLNARGLLRREGAGGASLLPLASGALLVFLAYYLGAKVGLALTFHPHPISVLWPPNAILLAALLLAPLRWWPALIVAAFPAHLLAELQDGVPAVMVLCWFVSNVSEALIGAACVRLLARHPLAFDSLRDIAVFIGFAALLAPFLSSFVDAGFVKLVGWSDSDYWQLWRSRFFSNILATLTLVPVIVTWTRSGFAALQSSVPGRLPEALALFVGLLAVSVFVFDLPLAGSGMPPALLYLPLPFLLWAALRFGAVGVSTAFTLVAFLVIWGAGHGRGPFINSAPIENAQSVQFFLIFVGITVFVLAAIVRERRSAEERLIRDVAERKAAEDALRASEERYREVVETQTELICRYARDGTLTFVNPAYCRYFGKSREELIGSSLLQQVPEAERETVLGLIETLARERTPITAEHRVVAADGSVRWQEWVDYAILASDGTIEEFQGIGRDVTDRKMAEDSLHRSDERFQLVLKATKAVIYDWETTTDTLWWSQNGLELFGYRGDQRLDNAWWVALLHPEDRELVASKLKAALAERRSQWDAEYRLRRADGSYAHVIDRGYVVRDPDGTPSRLIGSLLDVSDHKRLDEANTQLVHASRLAILGELSASVAHEINQPLGAILSNADAAEMLLASGTIPLEELKHIVEDLRRDAVRAGEVIRHMRSLMRRRELSVEPLDLNRAVSDVLHLVTADLARHRVSVDTAFAPLPIVRGDQVHLQQVVLNLILNGVDAMEGLPPSLRRLEISTGRSETGGVEVAVSDSGPGIPPEQMEQLFQSFYTTKRDGMGLGLAIARSIVEAHGGRIWAENRATGGATFRFVMSARGPGR